MEKFTREALRLMRDGETRHFDCGDSTALYSAASNTYQAAKIYGCRFTCQKDFERGVLTVTRLPENIKSK